MTDNFLQSLTDEELQGQLVAIEDQRRSLREQEIAITNEVDRRNLETKPVYPTDHQKAGIATACEWIKDGTPQGDHLGKHVNHYVVCSPQRGFISVQHNAPYSSRGSRMWDFTDEDEAAILAAIESHGMRITDHWQHDNGISYIVTERT